MAMSAEELVAATIHDLSHDGRGIADLSGQRVFVPGALPAEQVLLRTRRRRRKLQEAELVEIVTPASGRVEPGCSSFGICGGCALQHLAYAEQVAFKQRVVEQAFARIGRLSPERWETPITGPQWNYRRRARLGIKFVAAKERVLVGFRERAAAYITDMRRCPVLAPPMDEALGELADTVARTSIRDRMPQAEFAMGDEHGALVLRVLDPPNADDRGLLEAFGRQHDLDIYLQPGGPGTVEALGGEPRALSYSLADFGLRFEFAPTDFVQINAEINARMVGAAIAAAGFESSDRVLDLYCGIGNFSLPIAQQTAEVLGVEGEAALVARAARNAAQNGIANARFVAADLMESDWSFLRERWDVVFLDPARTGAEAAAASMGRMLPRRIVYVSCHPGTLARDAAVLVGTHGYRLSSARILDMFPHTHHVEAIAVFDRD